MINEYDVFDIHSPDIICPQVREHLRTFSAFYERAAVNYVDDLGVWGFVTDKHFVEWSYVNILLKIAFMRIKALLASCNICVFRHGLN